MTDAATTPESTIVPANEASPPPGRDADRLLEQQGKKTRGGRRSVPPAPREPYRKDTSSMRKLVGSVKSVVARNWTRTV
jgi:hypothetical protein